MSRRSRPLEIAIVGMSCRFPGARDLSAYWENIMAGKDCTRDVPADRWDSRIFVDPSSDANDRVPCGRGGYLDTPIAFDAAEHGIMPRTVEGGEPEQFLMLEAATAALADSGLAPEDLEGRRVEVVIGRGNYFNRGNLTRLQHGRMTAEILAILSALHPEWSESDREAIRAELKGGLPPFEAATIAGQLTNATAGRIAHRLDLDGAAAVVDAASASSLVALDLAARALIERRADLAIVGGVYIEADVDFPLVFRQIGAISRSGAARPFSADADGMLSGEGIGALILARRDDAEREGRRIYAIVQGLGLSSDGRSRGLAVPSARGHARAIRRAYRRSGIDPGTVMLVEGHGLGVPAADRAELRALNAVFPPPSHGRRALGAVSSMIGHAMPAAGMAGLIKTALAVYHRILPPTLHADRPHVLLDPEKSAFALNAEARPWVHPDPDTPRRAGVNAFGFAGINAHALLEEHPASSDRLEPGGFHRWETEAILLSAPDRAGLIDRSRRLIDWLGHHPDESLKDVAATLNCGEPSPGPCRLGLVASSPADLSARLASALKGLEDLSCPSIRDGRGAYFWEEPAFCAGAGGLAFLFPGEGSQYPGMMADLCYHFPEVLRRFDASDRIALELGDHALPSEYLFGRRSDRDGLWSTATAVNLVLTSQWAMYQVLIRLGLQPDAVVGHSSGELLAMAAAGVLQADRELERQLARLGTIFRDFESADDIPVARLAAVGATRDRVEAACRAAGTIESGVAIDNCPHQVILAGPPTEIERVVGILSGQNILVEDLPFNRAYHTPSFATVLAPVVEFFGQLTMRPASLPVYSCAARGRMPAEVEAMRELAVAQWTRTVAFRETVEAMHADGLRVFVDVGARGNLAGYVDDTLRGKPALAIASNLPRRRGLTQLNHLVAALFAQGVPLRADFLYARRRPRRLDWETPAKPPRTTVELELGFPEMRLTETLIGRLRSRGYGGDATAEGDESAATRRDPLVGPHHRNRSAEDKASRDPGAPGQNGSVHHEPAPAALDEAIPQPYPSRRLPEPFFLPSDAMDEAAPGAVSEVDSAILAFQETMRAFLETQRDVLAVYLQASSVDDPVVGEQGTDLDFESDLGTSPDPPGLVPGPWVGEVRRLVPGSTVETLYLLDGRGDPIAENHTLGGRRVSALDPTLKGLPVLPFAVMAEMTAQTAELVVSPGLVLTRLDQVKAHKWVRYEESAVWLELRGHRLQSEVEERVWVGIFNRGVDGRADAARPVFEAVAVFDVATPAPPQAASWHLEDRRPSRFTAESLYGEQWLFHGPAFQALVRVDGFSGKGIDGVLRVLPSDRLLRPGQPLRLHTDLIAIDGFTHLLGCWGLDELTAGGDVVFPLGMGALEIYGDRPPVGTDMACRIAIFELQRHRVRVRAEIVRPDGSVWMRIRDWEDWRFHWPGQYRDVFRQPRDIFVGEELELVDPSTGPTLGAKAVWLAPPADMGRPVWRDVLEQTQLGPEERAEHLALGGSERRRTHRLWRRIAAKEAARRIWQAEGRPPVYPADLAVVGDEQGRPRLARTDRPDAPGMPAIGIAEADGVVVAVATRDPEARVGVGVAIIADPPDGFEPTDFTPGERALLVHRLRGARDEWIARFRCAREAANRAMGFGGAGSFHGAEVAEVDDVSGLIFVRIASPDEGDRSRRGRPGEHRAQHDPMADALRVVTARRGDYAWGWALEGETTA
jgi:acyl transferase domain-containing protein